MAWTMSAFKAAQQSKHLSCFASLQTERFPDEEALLVPRCSPMRSRHAALVKVSSIR